MDVGARFTEACLNRGFTPTGREIAQARATLDELKASALWTDAGPRTMWQALDAEVERAAVMRGVSA